MLAAIPIQYVRKNSISNVVPSRFSGFTSGHSEDKPEMLRNILIKLHSDEDGQDLVEYALIVSLIGLGTCASMRTVSNYISNSFKTVGSSLTSTV